MRQLRQKQTEETKTKRPANKQTFSRHPEKKSTGELVAQSQCKSNVLKISNAFFGWRVCGGLGQNCAWPAAAFMFWQ